MFLFLLFETFISFIEITAMALFSLFVYEGWDSFTIIRNFLFCYFMGGFYIILQGLGLIYFKSSKDPLERISKIGYIQLCSINQRLNMNFMQNM